jgi:hypothetical protein
VPLNSNAPVCTTSINLDTGPHRTHRDRNRRRSATTRTNWRQLGYWVRLYRFMEMYRILNHGFRLLSLDQGLDEHRLELKNVSNILQSIIGGFGDSSEARAFI